MTWIFWSLSLLGHLALWVAVVNRIHAVRIPRKFIKGLTLLAFLWIPCGAALWLFDLYTFLMDGQSWATWRENAPRSSAYHFLLALYGAMTLGVWLKRKLVGDPHCYKPNQSQLSENQNRRDQRGEIISVAKMVSTPLYSGTTSKICRLWPWNESLSLQIEQRDYQMQRLPAALNNLRVVHLTDLHFTGRIAREYFEYVCQRVNELEPEIIFITGDIVDEAECIDWIPSTLGKLKARDGIYYVLGNHDSRTGELPRLHGTLREHGIHDVGGAWKVITARDSKLLIAGNELPWFGPSADLQHAPELHNNERLFRVLLTHSPDQFDYAVRWNFDLMLAGHLHGGQIALPWIGPIFSPSWHGVRYARGSFRRDQTHLHVSRGISAELPLRWNSRPQISLLQLQSFQNPKPQVDTQIATATI